MDLDMIRSMIAGEGREKAEGLRMLRKAANDGDVLAIVELGILYMHGNSVNQDTEEAAKWFKKAVDKDDPEAQYCLGMLYEYGDEIGRAHV